MVELAEEKAARLPFGLKIMKLLRECQAAVLRNQSSAHRNFLLEEDVFDDRWRGDEFVELFKRRIRR